MDPAVKHVALLLLAVMAMGDAQYFAQFGQQPQAAQYVPQPSPTPQYIQKPEQQQYAAIVSLRQGQSSDGAVNFNFATDHGLQQGETINPDGSRSGSYSYLDPEGKKISLKYSAGKDGFKILEGDHVPKSVLPAAAPQAQAPAPAAFPRYTDAGQYQGSPSYTKQAPVLFSSVQDDYRPKPANPYYSLQQDVGQHKGGRPSPYYNVQEEQDTGRFYASPQASQFIASENYDATEEQGPKKPHNFGPGYAFEIAG